MWPDEMLFQRTAAGELEVSAASARLGKELYNLLLLINGRRRWGGLKAIAPQLKDSPALMLYLEDNGFVEPASKSTGAVDAGAPSAVPNAPVPRVAESTIRPSYPSPISPVAVASTHQRLSEFRAELSRRVGALFGAEAAPVLKKIADVRDPAAAQLLLERLTEMVSLYAGPREAKQLSDAFNGWFR